MVSSKEFEDFVARLPGWRQALEKRRAPVLLTPESIAVLKTLLGNLERRLRDGPDAPLRVAFFGPTGVGKSKIFNSLIGRTLSPSGYRRPCTRQPLYFVHDDWRSLAPALAGDVHLHEEPRWRHVVLIDTPDFDSVELDHRRQAERVFAETDALLFVTDGLKYADASTWEYLGRIFPSEKPFRVALNKVSSREVLDDFRRRLAEHSGPEHGEPADIVFPELPIDDASLIPANHPSLEVLRRTLQEMLGAGGGGRNLSVALFRRELGQLFAATKGLLENAGASRRNFDGLRSRLETRYEAAAESLKVELTSEVDPAVKTEISRRILQRLEKIDVLRYPRRLLAMPIEGIKLLFSRWWRPESSDSTEKQEDRGSAALSESFQLLESALLSLCDATHRDIASSPALKKLLTRSVQQELRFAHDELVVLYNERSAKFRDWVAENAQKMAAELSNQNKLKFILSQVIFNTVLIGAQVHTGGMFTLVELGFDSVLSPLAAKAVSMVIASDDVREFEKLSHEEYHRMLRSILYESRGRYEGFLERAGAGLDELEALLIEVTVFEDREAAIAERFAGTGTSPAHESEATKPA